MKIEEIRDSLGDTEIPNNGNFYALKVIRKHPEKLAIKYPFFVDNKLEYKTLTFGEFEAESLKWAQGLLKNGHVQGDRILLLIPVSLELYHLIFACFYIGVIPVFVDISMKRKNILNAIKASRAESVISIDRLLKFSPIVPALWGKKSYSIDKVRFWSKPLSKLRSTSKLLDPCLKQSPSSAALITFTSGSGGVPKGANRTIEILLNQKVISEYMWKSKSCDLDMPCFPMIVLQNLGCGISSVLPCMNFQNLTLLDPSLINKQLQDEGITRLSAQPFVLEQISDYIIKNNIKTSVESLVVGGACVSKRLCHKILKAFPGIDANIVYGSTEVEPIASTKVSKFIETKGRGLLLGELAPSLNLRIIDVKKPVIDKSLPVNHVGEIVMSGAHVVKEYIDNHPSNKELKMTCREGLIWHRTGDMGYIDSLGMLWLVGRIKDRVYIQGELTACYDLEALIEEIQGVRCAALIKEPKVLFIQKDAAIDAARLKARLFELKIDDYRISYIESIPVDKRHFSRVDRDELRRIAIS